MPIRNSRFRFGSGCFSCSSCGKRTRQTGRYDYYEQDQCDACIEMMEQENAVSDNEKYWDAKTLAQERKELAKMVKKHQERCAANGVAPSR